jgi:O-antigen/teichoic acid export membrane protein
MKTLAVRNGLWNALANIVGGVSAILGSVIIVRSLDPAAYGTFSYYMWLASMMITLGTLAFPSALTKITAELIGRGESREANAISRVVILGLVVLNVTIAAALIIWAIHGNPERQPYLIVIAALVIPNGSAGILLSVFWGQERYRPVSIMFVFASLVQISLILVALQMGTGVTGFIAASLSANVVQSIGLVILLKRKQSAAFDIWGEYRLPSWSTFRHYVAFVTPATLSQIFAVIVWERSEVFFLERLSTIEQVGIYGVAYTMLTMTMYLGWALVNGFFPAISRDFGSGNWEGIREKFQQAATLATLYAVPLALGAVITMERIILLLYGEKMLPAVPVAQLLMVGLVPAVFASVLGLSITAVGGIWTHVRMGFLMSGFNIALSLLLIPEFGAIGAAIGNTVAQGVHVGILIILVHRRYQMKLPLLEMGKITGIGLVTTLGIPLAILTIMPGTAGLLIALAVSGLAYLGSVWQQGFDSLFWPRENIPVPGAAGN